MRGVLPVPAPGSSSSRAVDEVLEALDRTLLTRRDIEQLFGISKVRAATLMQTFGAEMTGNQRTLPRTKLLRQLKKHRARAAFRHEEPITPPAAGELTRPSGPRTLPVRPKGGDAPPPP